MNRWLSLHPKSHRAAPGRALSAAACLAALLAVAALAGCTGESDAETFVVTGILTEEGGDCQALVGEDGTLYTLTGELGDLRSGDTIQVVGAAAREGACSKGIAIEAEEIELIDGPSKAHRAASATGTIPTEGDTMDDEQIFLEGKLTDEGVECPAFRSDEDELYTLTGDLEGHGPGERVRIVAIPMAMSTCMQGTTVEIVEITSIE